MLKTSIAFRGSGVPKSLLHLVAMSVAEIMDIRQETTRKIVGLLKDAMGCDSDGFFKKDVYTILAEAKPDDTKRGQFHDQITALKALLVSGHGQSPPPEALKVILRSR